MKTALRATLLLFPLLLSPAAFADPVPIPCDPAKDCPPIDPCKINPDRCKDKGGPINKD
ncbi:MAG: hypothetical protein ACOY3X_00905 [Pseudomonadota bacterium]